MLTDLALTVPDPLATAAFYELLGGWADYEDDIPRVHFDRWTLYLWRGEPASRVGLGLYVDDLAAVRVRLIAAGFQVREAGAGAAQFCVRDPDHNLITVRARSAVSVHGRDTGR
ncbi:VOC family protein [Mycobacterium sp. M1]|uniref:VOC family protein n=1 Tax=Mycolicibacter acidiphilus TaxID=2835306 RepID=A0ABS5RLR1_9MYCO|nr:VOC family protein [Mycolicibacter acidiphilus]MBS9535109.1 VOC family protein [Mycolicibacter acidiphilus]